jgi:hypothetical protein
MVPDREQIKPDDDRPESSPVFSTLTSGEKTEEPSPDIRAEALTLAAKASNARPETAAAKVEALARRFGWATAVHALRITVEKLREAVAIRNPWGFAYTVGAYTAAEGGPPPPPPSVDWEKIAAERKAREAERKLAEQQELAQRRLYFERRLAAEEKYIALQQSLAAQRKGGRR